MYSIYFLQNTINIKALEKLCRFVFIFENENFQKAITTVLDVNVICIMHQQKAYETNF